MRWPVHRSHCDRLPHSNQIAISVDESFLDDKKIYPRRGSAKVSLARRTIEENKSLARFFTSDHRHKENRNLIKSDERNEQQHHAQSIGRSNDCRKNGHSDDGVTALATQERRIDDP